MPTEDESSPQSLLDKALHLLRTTVNGYFEIINESIRGDVNEAYNELKDGCLAVQTIENESRHTAQQIIASAEQEAKGIIEGADLVAKQREEYHQQLVAERNKSIKRYNEAVFVLQNTIKLQGAEYSEAAQNKHTVNLCKFIKGCHEVLVQNATISSTRAEQARLSHEDFKTKYDSLLIKYNVEYGSFGYVSSAMWFHDSQPSLGSGRACYPNCMISRTAPGELEETIRHFMLPEPFPHT